MLLLVTLDVTGYNSWCYRL